MSEGNGLPENRASNSEDSAFAVARQHMVETQIRARGIDDVRLIAAFQQVPRHEFVPPGFRSQAYRDGPLPIGENQTISQPYMVAAMTQAAQIQSGEKVLEIGTGSGYQTAILAQLGARVYTVERRSSLFHMAQRTLSRLGYEGISYKLANGTLGWEEEAPFDVILVTAGAPDIPETLTHQLAPGGRLVIPVEEGPSQVLYVVKKTERGLVRIRGDRCSFVPLIGEHGWKE